MGGVVESVKLPISVLIIARNEEGLIRRAVKSCALFAEDVVVVDAFSTDRTVSLAQASSARVVQREWTGFGDQRNFSLSQAKCDWVLVLDADEAATSGLRDWLEAFFREGREKCAPFGYKIKRAEYFLGKRIHSACWNPSFQDRFFRHDKAKYVGVIHEYPVVEGGFVRAPESAFIEHNPNVTVESFFEKMNRYTTIEAMDRFRSGQRTALPHLGIVFFGTWARNFFKYKGYRDGAHGFVICLMEAVSRTVRHIKLWQIQQMHKEGKAELLPDPRATLDSPHRRLEARSADEK